MITFKRSASLFKMEIGVQLKHSELLRCGLIDVRGQLLKSSILQVYKKRLYYMNVRLSEIKEGEEFEFEGEKLELVNHDHSGSLSSGPFCRTVPGGGERYLYYLDREMKATMVHKISK